MYENKYIEEIKVLVGWEWLIDESVKLFVANYELSLRNHFGAADEVFTLFKYYLFPNDEKVNTGY